MTKEQFKSGTKALDVDILKVCDAMPRRVGGQVVSRQLARSGSRGQLSGRVPRTK